jgi:hypothetical protein
MTKTNEGMTKTNEGMTLTDAQFIWEQFKAEEAEVPEFSWQEDNNFRQWSDVVSLRPSMEGAIKGHTALLKLVQEYQLQERAEAAEKLWESKSLWWQGALQLLRLKGGADWITSLTTTEWETRQVDKSRGLKGSPKLSKQLVAAGCPAREVEILLSAKKVSGKAYVAGVEKRYILDQGNSRHFRSCQATNPDSLWGDNDSYHQLEGDLKSYGISLFQFVCGVAMCDGDQMGWSSRAKLRVLTTRKVSNSELAEAIEFQEAEGLVAGLYIDRPYGDHLALLNSMEELKEWWSKWCSDAGVVQTLPIFIAPVWERSNGEGADFELRFGGASKPMFSPSSVFGYPDTMTRDEGPYTFLKNVTESFLVRAYKARHQEGGARLGALKEVTFNPQSSKFTSVKSALRARPQLNEDRRWCGFQAARILDGYEKGSLSLEDCDLKSIWVKKGSLFIRVNKETFSSWSWGNSQKLTMAFSTAPSGQGTDFLAVKDKETVVVEDCPELGFHKAMWFATDRVDDATIVVTDYPELGFVKAVPLPYEYEDGALVVTANDGDFQKAENVERRFALVSAWGVEFLGKDICLFDGLKGLVIFYYNYVEIMFNGFSLALFTENGSWKLSVQGRCPRGRFLSAVSLEQA